MPSKQRAVNPIREAHTVEQLLFYVKKSAIQPTVDIRQALTAIRNTASLSGATNLLRKDDGDDMLIVVPLSSAITQSNLSTLPVKLLSLIHTEFEIPKQR